MNINSKKYWDERFESDWDEKGGRDQTTGYAQKNSKYINLPSSFNGTIIDLGCAFGDAIPVYKKKFPKAKLIGIDISDIAIKSCKEKYGLYADFKQGSFNDVPKTDIIITSHVMEHIADDKEVVKRLLSKCENLYVFVPFQESPLFFEHVNYYDKDYYNEVCSDYNFKVFKIPLKAKEYFIIYRSNFIKFLKRKPLYKIPRVIMFHFRARNNNYNTNGR